MSVFISLITILNKINNIYTIYELGDHTKLRKTISKTYKSFGLKNLNYEPVIFDSGEAKFVWVRQKYSGDQKRLNLIKQNKKKCIFNLYNFYGKYIL